MVCAIGDGLNDALMMQAANISIEKVHIKKDEKKKNENQPKEYNVVGNVGDIQISELSQINDLFLKDGVGCSLRLQNITYFLFYKSFLLSIPLFLFNWYSSFTGTTIHNSMFLFLYQFLFSSVNILFYGLYDKPVDFKVIKLFPALYLDGISQRKSIIQNFLVRCVIEATLQAILIYYMTIYIVSRSLASNGKSSDLSMISVMLIYCLIAIHNLKVIIYIFYYFLLYFIIFYYNLLCFIIFYFILFYKIFAISRNSIVWIFWIFMPIPVLLVLAYIYINNNTKWNSYDFPVASFHLFSRFDTALGVAYNILASYLIDYFFTKYINYEFFPTLYEKFSRKSASNFLLKYRFILKTNRFNEN